MAKRICILGAGGTPGQVRTQSGELVPTTGIGELIPELRRRYAFDGLDILTEELFNIDSSEMGTDHEDKLGYNISKKMSMHENQYDGIVVIHGTDTMTATLQALYLGLKNRTVPVTLTGSQISADQPDTDFFENLRGSIESTLAREYTEPVIFFNGGVYRADVAHKVDTMARGAFANLSKRDGLSDECESVGRAEYDVSHSRVKVYKLHRRSFDENDFEIDLVSHAGLVIEGYGMGNCPKKMMEVLKACLSEKPKPVILSSSAGGQTDQTEYSSGKQLIQNKFEDRDGSHTPLVATSGDWTTEYCLTRLSYILGHIETKEIPVRQVHELFLMGCRVRRKELYEEITGERVYVSDLLNNGIFERGLTELRR